MEKPTLDMGPGSGVAGGNLQEDIIKDTTTRDFVTDVIEASKEVPVMVDFWSTRCSPCKQLTPILEKAVTEANGAVKLVKMNVDEHPSIFSQIASQLGVQSIPAVIVFKDSQPIDGFVGALPESEVKQFIAKISGGSEEDINSVLETADEAFAEGDLETALEVYLAVLEEDNENVKAIAGSAKCYVELGNLEEAKAVLDKTPVSKKDLADIASVRANIELKEKSGVSGDLTNLQEKVSANPEDFQAQFDLAVAQNAEGNKAEAMDLLFGIMQRKPKWNDEAAKTQLLQFFDAWGAEDPDTLEGRKRLSIFLFS